MPAPTNTDFTTATALGTLPQDVTQRVDDAGVTYSVYFSFTASADGVCGGFAFGDLVTYRPQARVYEGPVDDPTEIFNIRATNLPFYFPVVAGRTYFIEVNKNLPNPSPANLRLQVEMFAPSSALRGSIVDPNDGYDGSALNRGPFPAAVVQRSTGHIIRFMNLPAGEWGDVLDDGTGRMLLENKQTDSAQLHSSNGVLLTDVGTLGFDASGREHKIRMSPGLQEFFVGRSGGGGDNASLHRVSSDGVLIESWTLPTAGLTSQAPNNDGSIVYLSGQTTSSNAPIKRWDTSGAGAFLSDLIAGQGGTWTNRDMLVLTGGNIVVLWTSASQAMVKVIQPDGTVVGTLTQSNSLFGRLAYDPDHADQFWLWRQLGDYAETSEFQRIDAETLTAIETVPSVDNFEDGVWPVATPSETPPRYGISQSCPFFLIRLAIGDEADVVPPDGMIGPYVWVHWPLRRQA